MASTELERLDAPVCPFLGLATDARSHFTYANPIHRCFATGRPKTTDAFRQAKYCLNLYAACDRYQARHERAPASESPDPPHAFGDASSEPGGSQIAASVASGTVIRVFREGDSLLKLATTYGLTVEQLSAANGLTLNAKVADGTPLVIPLSPPASSSLARASTRIPRDGVG
jgi:hypothetical protein